MNRFTIYFWFFFSLASQAQPTQLSGPASAVALLNHGAPSSMFMPVVGFMVRVRSSSQDQISWFTSVNANYSVNQKSINLSVYKTVADVDRFFDMDLPVLLPKSTTQEVLVLTGPMSIAVEDALIPRLARIIADGGYSASNGLQFSIGYRMFFIEVSHTVNLGNKNSLMSNTHRALHWLRYGNHDLYFFRLDEFQSIMSGIGGGVPVVNCSADLFSKPPLVGEELWKTIVDASQQ